MATVQARIKAVDGHESGSPSQSDEPTGHTRCHGVTRPRGAGSPGQPAETPRRVATRNVAMARLTEVLCMRTLFGLGETADFVKRGRHDDDSDHVA